MHVAISSVEKLLDYVMNTPEDGFTSDASVHKIMNLIEKNLHSGENLENLHVKEAHPA